MPPQPHAPDTPPAAHPSLLILGGGGHALVVAEAAAITGWTVLGFLDDGAKPVLATAGPGGEAGLPHLGRFADLGRVLEQHPHAAAIIAVGDAGVRRGLITDLVGVDRRLATVIHPAAAVSPSASIGAGVFIGPRAVVHTRAVIGNHSIVNTGAIVEHECVVGENAHIAPGAVLGGRARVEPDALVGIGSRVMLNRVIGRGAVVGCGAVVVKDVAPGAVVRGVPAR